MNEKLEILQQELQRPPSRRRKKVKRLVTSELITEIQSEIIKINSYLTSKCINNRGNYKPHTGDEDQPLRERAKYLIDLVEKLKKI